VILIIFLIYIDWKNIIFIDISQILKVVPAVDMYLNMMNQIIICNYICRNQFFDAIEQHQFSLI